MGTPFADRNLVDFSANLGLVLKDPFPYRTMDSLGLGMGFTHVSRAQANADTDSGALRRTSETYIEATYQRQVTPWLQIQPDIQYVFHPGAGVTGADGQTVRNELVGGVRANILL